MKNDRNEIYENKSPQAEAHEEKKRENKNTGLKVVITLMSFVIIGLVIGLSIVGTRTTNNVSDTSLKNAAFQRAYFDLVAETNDISVKMSKLDASNDATQQTQMLYDVWKTADLAGMSLASLSSQDEGLSKLKKFMNQTSDYCHYLAIELNSEKTLSQEDEATLKKMSEILRKVNVALGDVHTQIESGNMDMATDGVLSGAIGQIFIDFNETAVEYPQLIYDGPFSDALADKETKGLSGADIDEATGREFVQKAVGSGNIKEIKFDGEWHTDIVTLNYTAVFENNDSAMVQVAKKGGKVLLLDRDREIGGQTLTSDECVDIAEKYMSGLGYENLKSVWVTNMKGSYYVNLCPTMNDVVIYPDMIKVKVASDNGEILGVDAKSYAYNHTNRTLPAPTVGIATARKAIKSSLNPNEGRLALIPYRNAERLTYEFACEGNGLYFVYVDAETGKEINILYVIDSENGSLLM
ncbi:MAG TPA: PepSY1/2 domain-containing protein [Clostridia bacterium]|nr:PepSY1/2 domain-containing protein [Clostridia bacterium]